jgi:hypothetical protein
MEDTMNWRKASYSNGGENCVETASQAGVVLVRDSKDISIPALAFGAESWAEFTNSLK